MMFKAEIFADLIKKAIADDTGKDFADKSGVDRSYLSKFLNQKYTNPPSPEILSKISRASGNRVSYDELMAAAGYLDKLQYQTGTFVKENIDLLRGNMSYKEMAKAIAEKVNNPVLEKYFSEQYLKGLATGEISPPYARIDLLSQYVGVESDFFYKANTLETLEQAREDFENIKPIINTDLIHLNSELLEFVANPMNVGYIELAKNICDKGIDPDSITGFTTEHKLEKK
jgi:transcriptional regulator with XRE-family HTH domain